MTICHCPRIQNYHNNAYNLFRAREMTQDLAFIIFQIKSLKLQVDPPCLRKFGANEMWNSRLTRHRKYSTSVNFKLGTHQTKFRTATSYGINILDIAR